MKDNITVRYTYLAIGIRAIYDRTTRMGEPVYDLFFCASDGRIEGPFHTTHDNLCNWGLSRNNISDGHGRPAWRIDTVVRKVRDHIGKEEIVNISNV